MAGFWGQIEGVTGRFVVEPERAEARTSPGLLLYLSNGQDAIALTKAENIGGGSVRTRAAGIWSLRFLCGTAPEAAELSSLGLRERLVVQT